jgi:hypothetical protein
LPLFFRFVLEYINEIKKIQGNQEGLGFTGTYQLLVYAIVVNVVGENINTMKEKTEALSGASK